MPIFQIDFCGLRFESPALACFGSISTSQGEYQLISIA